MVPCDDVAAVPDSSEFLWISRKCKNLGDLARLRRLKRVHCTLQDELLEQLTRSSSLRYLQVELPRSDDIPSLRNLQNLHTLVVKCNKHQTHLEFLAGLDNLRFLCVSEAIGVNRLAPLGDLQSLCELYIDGTLSKKNTVQTLAPIGQLAELRYAVLLLRVQEEHRSLSHLHSLSRLKFLRLSNDYPAEDYDQLLAAIPGLKHIHFNAGGRWPDESR